jgi:hypothetical protein
VRRGQLNWADLNGLLAVVLGPLGGMATSAGRGAGWPLVVLFAILGCGVGIASAKILGRVAYACLAQPQCDAGAFMGYMLLSLAMPVTSLFVSCAVPAMLLARGVAV